MKTAALIFVVCASMTAQSSQAHQLTIQQARSIVGASLSDVTRKLPGFALEDFSNDKTPDFFFITAVWDNPHGSVVQGNFYVDKATGDLWSAVIECDEIASEKVRTVQRKIQKEIGLSEGEYRKLKRPGPLCEASAKGTPQSAAIPHN